MGKKKLLHFKEMETFNNVFQPLWDEIKDGNYSMKGNWNKKFFGNNNPIIIELGCGKGEYTVGMAQMFPEKNFIGIDYKGARLWRGAKTSTEKNFKNVAFIRAKVDFIESLFSNDEIDEIWLTFPDPQIKKPRKRLSSAKFINSYCKILKNEGIVHLKTDSFLLHGFTHNLVKLNNLDVIHCTTDLYNSGTIDNVLNLKTFYELNYLERDLKITYLSFKLNKQVQIIDPEEDTNLVQKEVEERKLTRTNKVIRHKPVDVSQLSVYK